MHKSSVGVHTRVSAVEAFLVGKDDEYIRLDQVGDQGTQGVVVAEFDFIVDYRVVLVDHREHAVAEQGEQSRARVEVTLAVG